MKKTNFIDCSVKEVDFSETDLSMSIFKNCDLSNTVFQQTNLEKADFRTAKNYAFDPAENKVKKVKVSHLHLSGLLEKFDLDID
ncbi:pentapeptide repeat-containing protein [Flavobacterium sp.]|uniref:pentapeptide repeat-containing protein n=1 Tax=Flavobacterium sp. TaxID=239 RepID=UPI0039C8B562